MRIRTKLAAAVAALCAVGTLVLPSTASANPTVPAPPKTPGISKQLKPAVKAGSVNAKAMAAKGKTQTVKTDANGKPTRTYSARTGYVSGVDFTSVYNYCWANFVYTPVHNSTAATQYIEVQLYNGGWRTYYTSVAAGGTAYVPWYGVTGTYYAYLYVWNGSSYGYDEYETSANNCSIAVNFYNYSSAGYVLVGVTNSGNAYASVNVAEVAPYASYSTYTGNHWVYPAAGSTAYQWLYVGFGRPFGIFASVYGASSYGVWTWTGQF